GQLKVLTGLQLFVQHTTLTVDANVNAQQLNPPLNADGTVNNKALGATIVAGQGTQTLYMPAFVPDAGALYFITFGHPDPNGTLDPNGHILIIPDATLVATPDQLSHFQFTIGGVPAADTAINFQEEL